MQEVVGEGNDVLQMSEGVFVEHLADYPDMELSWLQQLYESSTHGAEGTTLNSVMNSMLIPSLSGLTKKVRRVPYCRVEHGHSLTLQLAKGFCCACPAIRMWPILFWRCC